MSQMAIKYSFQRTFSLKHEVIPFSVGNNSLTTVYIIKFAYSLHNILSWNEGYAQIKRLMY